MNELENRCLQFAIDIRLKLKNLPRNTSNVEDFKQVVRSSGSIGSNYIEANESLGDKDKLFRMRIARKEAKETIYWLTILENTNREFSKELHDLIGETDELKKIISAIITKLSR
ncbi:four helix bundle protein [Mangrovibacterium lignilyticum]|uniref:four helix bundle protein n=1 Tax=Mangrovibacterium lignilyticum TaxID=2668052 RepID=UPI0013D29822|nr:four helix bundle protein [Mangrovibacterium lignilyticum]